MPRRTTAWLAAMVPLVCLSAAAVAASATVPAESGAAGDPVGALRVFRDCAQLRSWYARATLPQVTPWGLNTPYVGPIFSDGVTTTIRAEPRAALAPATNSSTGTNVQEAGVDEPDVAKTDGERVVLIDQGVLRVFDVTGEEPSEVASLALPAGVEARRLVLVDDRAVLLGTTRGRKAFLTTVDLTDAATPRLIHTETVRGQVISTRMHEGTVRVVVSSEPHLDFVHPTRDRSPREALHQNRQIVRQASAREWLPNQRVDQRWEPLLDCIDVRHPRKPAGAGTISVLTIDPHRPAEPDITGVAADGDLVYASTNRLYVATTAGAGKRGCRFRGCLAGRALRRRQPSGTRLRRSTPSTSPDTRRRTWRPAACLVW